MRGIPLQVLLRHSLRGGAFTTAVLVAVMVSLSDTNSVGVHHKGLHALVVIEVPLFLG